jgi:RNA polymerase sigma factor (sigma-70 family)
MPVNKNNEFEVHLAPHLNALFRVAYRLTRSVPDAQDLVQDICIVACEHLSDLAAAERPVAWLLRALHNRFVDKARRQQRSPLVAIDDHAQQAAAVREPEGPEELLQQADGERQLQSAFMRLDETQRTLLSLRAEGYGLEEIESITGIAREVLRARLHRARRSLAERLDDQRSMEIRVSRVGSES